MAGRREKGTALVTGATRRIGLAIATKLAKSGYNVALHASPRSQKQGELEAKRLADFGVQTCTVAGDLMNATSCSKIIDMASARLGPLTLLVNNASLFEADSADDVDLGLWEHHFAVNLRAPLILAKYFAAQAGDGAAIVNLIDQRVLNPTPLFFSYTLSKSALWSATRTMAQALASRGIRVNAIGPGPVLPNTNEGNTGFMREVENVPLQHAVNPEDIGEAVLYLAGARSVTGQLIAVDAGQHLAWHAPDAED